MPLDRLIKVSKKPILHRFFCGLVIAGFWSSATPALAESLDEKTAIRLGLEQDPVRELLGGRLDAARGTAQDAGRWQNPEVKFERQGTDGFSGPGTENYYTLSQTIDFSGQRGLERHAAEARLRAEKEDTDEYRQQLAAEVSKRFHAVLRGEYLARAAREWISQLERLDNIIARREAAGETSNYDRRRMALELAAGPALLAEVQAERDAARERLTALIGRDNLKRYDGLSGEILPPPPASLEQLIGSQQNQPALKSLEARAEAYDFEQQASRRSVIPDVTLSVGVRRIENDITEDTDGLLFSASIPVPLLNRHEGATRRASGQARVSRAEYEIGLSRARAEVRAGWQRLVALRKSAIEYRADAAAPADQLKSTAEISYEAGEVGILELLDAYETAFDAERRALELEMKARLAEINLDRLTGESLP